MDEVPPPNPKVLGWIVEYASKYGMSQVLDACDALGAGPVDESASDRLEITKFLKTIEDKEFLCNYAHTEVVEWYDRIVPQSAGRGYNSPYFFNLVEMKIQALMLMEDPIRLFKKKAAVLLPYAKEKEKEPIKAQILKEHYKSVVEYHKLKISKRTGVPAYRRFEKDHPWDKFLEGMRNYVGEIAKEMGKTVLDKIEESGDWWQFKRPCPATYKEEKDVPTAFTAALRKARSGPAPADPDLSSEEEVGSRRPARSVAQAGEYGESSEEEQQVKETEEEEQVEESEEEEQVAQPRRRGRSRRQPAKKGGKGKEQKKLRDQAVQSEESGDESEESEEESFVRRRPGRRKGESAAPPSVSPAVQDESSEEEDDDAGEARGDGEVESADEKENVATSNRRTRAARDLENKRKRLRSAVDDPLSSILERAKKARRASKYDVPHPEAKEVEWEEADDIESCTTEPEPVNKRLKSPKRKKFKKALRKTESDAKVAKKNGSGDNDGAEPAAASSARARSGGKKSRRTPRRWTEQEVENLKKGHARFGHGSWAKIRANYKFNDRTSVDLKDKWRNLQRRLAS